MAGSRVAGVSDDRFRHRPLRVRRRSLAAGASGRHCGAIRDPRGGRQRVLGARRRMDRRRDRRPRRRHAPHPGLDRGAPRARPRSARGIGGVLDLLLAQRAATPRHCSTGRAGIGACKPRRTGPIRKPLKRAIVARNHPILRETLSSYRHQIERAVQRGDSVSVQHRVSGIARQLLRYPVRGQRVAPSG